MSAAETEPAVPEAPGAVPAPAPVAAPVKPAAIATRAELSKAYPKIQSDFKKFEVSFSSTSRQRVLLQMTSQVFHFLFSRH